MPTSLDPIDGLLQTLREKMMFDSMTRFRGCKTVGRGYVWKFGEQVLDTLRSGEEISLEWS
jgi:hypothetical protein